MKKYLLEFVVFITGAVVMILELCGSRILAPYVGVSLVVWTSLIGIILGSLSLGYYLGGKIADKKGSGNTLSQVILASAFFVAVILLLRTSVLVTLESLQIELAAKAVAATVILFAFPSIALGMVSPLAVKLKLKSLKATGGTVGNLYALSTIGSIAGTFLAGFVLLAYFSVTQILVGLCIVLFLLAILVSVNDIAKKAIIGILVVFLLKMTFVYDTNSKKVFESRYNHVEIIKQGNVKILKLDNKWHSAAFVKGEGLVFPYTKYYHLVKTLNPDVKKILMIGGGAYTVPQDFLRQYDDVSFDVVEIDPFLTRLSKEEFGLKEDPRISIYHEDGRTFLNREVRLGRKKYDAIFVDVFSSFSIPFHLATHEAVEKMSLLLNGKGIVMANVISAIDGEKGQFLQAEYATYKSVFPHVVIYPVNSKDPAFNQNLMVVASKNNVGDTLSNAKYNKVWNLPISRKPVLTDDFAPVDQYVRINEM